MSKPIITLTSDFGDTFAKSQLEAVIYSIAPDVKFLVASNEVTPYSILEGSFVLQKFYPLTPPGSVHIAIIDPGVGSERRGIIIKTTNHWFVGPDNGVLYPAALEDGIQKVYVLKEEYFKSSLSITFHGRDLFCKAAAYIILGRDITEFAEETGIHTLCSYVHPPTTIAHIDPYGNAKLTEKIRTATYGRKYNIRIGNSLHTIPYVRTFAEVEIGSPLLYLGSHDTLEIAVNQGSAKEYFNFQVGDEIFFHDESTGNML